MIDGIQAQLERDEGRRLTAYPDTKGWLTIGIGHNLRTKDVAQIPPQFRKGITDQQCDDLFSADLHYIYDLCDTYLPWWQQLDGLRGPRSNVLVNLSFNLGVAGLSHFHEFLGFMRARDWESAAADLEKTPWYHQVGERSARLCRQIRTGEFQ